MSNLPVYVSQPGPDNFQVTEHDEFGRVKTVEGWINLRGVRSAERGKAETTINERGEKIDVHHGHIVAISLGGPDVAWNRVRMERRSNQSYLSIAEGTGRELRNEGTMAYLRVKVDYDSRDPELARSITHEYQRYSLQSDGSLKPVGDVKQYATNVNYDKSETAGKAVRRHSRQSLKNFASPDPKRGVEQRGLHEELESVRLEQVERNGPER